MFANRRISGSANRECIASSPRDGIVPAAVPADPRNISGVECISSGGIAGAAFKSIEVEADVVRERGVVLMRLGVMLMLVAAT
jgi:hypothetical protein